MLPETSSDESTSSCIPSVLIGITPYTDGISEGMAVRINAAVNAAQYYLASCDPSFFPDGDGLTSRAQSWTSGLKALGGWTRAVGEAFLAAATDGPIDRPDFGDGFPSVPASGAVEDQKYYIPADAGWTVPDSVLAALSKKQVGGGISVPDDVGAGIDWQKSSDPYEDVLHYVSDPGHDTDLGSTILGTAANLSGDGSDLAKDLGHGSAVLGGISDVIDVASELKDDIGEDGVPGGIAHAGINFAAGAAGDAGGDSVGEAVGSFLGETAGDIGGPIGGLLGGIVLGDLVGGITNALFGPSPQDAAKDGVANASPGSTVAFNEQAERDAINRLKSTDPDLVPAADEALKAELEAVAPHQAVRGIQPPSPPQSTPWRPTAAP